MRCAGKTRVIGAESHFNHIQNAVGYIAVLYQLLCRFFDRHADSRRIIDGRNDQVHFGYNAVFVGLIMVNQRAARGFHNADALFRRRRRNISYIRIGDLLVLASSSIRSAA